MNQNNKRHIDWPVALFLILNPILGFLLLGVCLVYSSVPMAVLIFAIIFAAATNLSITAGYHRLFSHRSYEAHPLMKLLLLMVGSSGFQGSALKWSSDHRRHHANIDTDDDPYSIEKGFWYAHMGWMFYKESVGLEIKAPDLLKDKLVVNQDKYYLIWAIGSGFLFPTLVGWALGSWLAGLVVAGSLRIFLTQQSTFFVNSLCHTLGRKTYSKEISARDSLLVAFLTHGEGYHNFHHKFQLDYRNGIKWYQWDPTKWTILLMKWAGLAQKLKTIPAQEILRARLQVEGQLMQTKGFSQDQVEALKLKILKAQNQWKEIKEDYEKRKNQWSENSQIRLGELKLQMAELRIQMKKAKADFKFALEEWQLYLATQSLNY